jgi:ligand-binding SRPBCC domain-containing protein
VQTIVVETRIAAPPERCFLLSLSIDLHVESTAQTGERAVAGVTHGLLSLGDTVTWQGRHFGFFLTHETLITKYERPHYFQDVMVKGMFRSFEHDHSFEPSDNGGAMMRDELRFTAPLGPVGWIAESLVLRSYLTKFLRARNEQIRRVAESPERDWQRYLSGAAPMEL